MKIIDVIILLLAIAMVIVITYKTLKKRATNKKNGAINCSSGCDGCKGCDDLFIEIREKAAQRKEKENN